MGISAVSNSSCVSANWSKDSDTSSDNDFSLTYSDIVKKEMDTNGDGEISEDELKKYIEKKKHQTEEKLESNLLKNVDSLGLLSNL